MAYYISKMKHVDIKGQGSKNYGASNTVALAGKRAGALVFTHDFLKAVVAVLLASFLFPQTSAAGTVAGCASVFGHIFPFYLKFDGGKGFASFIGVAIALYPIEGLVVLVVSLVLALVSDYIVASTFMFILTMPILALIQGDYVSFTLLFATAILIVWKHKNNIKNLITKNGKEMRIRTVLNRNAKKGSENCES
jgi:glycerol-3-phosphate acyltransferase PlsY